MVPESLLVLSIILQKLSMVKVVVAVETTPPVKTITYWYREFQAINMALASLAWLTTQKTAINLN